jgi:hypothetical protein
MKIVRRVVLMSLLSLGLAAGTVQSATIDLAGVKVEDSYNLKGTTLALNGAGIRYKAVFKVYAASLYVTKKSTVPEEVLSQPGPKRISVTMLRNIDANELGKLFARGVEDNMPKADFAKVIPGILRMSQLFSEYKNLKTGDTFDIEYLLGTGTIISVKGKAYGEPFKEPEFFNALLRIWIGQKPADWKLKDSLLGI